MKKLLATGSRPRMSHGKIQPLLLFLLGLGFLVLGLRSYPAFIGVGGLFLIISYRGYTCRSNTATEKKKS